MTITLGADELTFSEAAAQRLISVDLLDYEDGGYAAINELKPYRAYLLHAFEPCVLNLP